MPGPTPLLSPFVLCDMIIRDRNTSKPSLIGLISGLVSPTFPVRLPTLCVYAKAVDAQGTYAMRLELVRLETMETIGEAQGDVTIPDRLRYHEIIFELYALQFPAAGQYEFRLYADTVFLGHQVLDVTAAGAQ